MHPTLARALLDTAARPSKEKKSVAQLTPRETEVLRLLARGMSNKDICSALVIGEKTVKTHVSNVLSKLGVSSRGEAIALAIEHKLVL